MGLYYPLDGGPPVRRPDTDPTAARPPASPESFDVAFPGARALAATVEPVDRVAWDRETVDLMVGQMVAAGRPAEDARRIAVTAAYRNVDGKARPYSERS